MAAIRQIMARNKDEVIMVLGLKSRYAKTWDRYVRSVFPGVKKKSINESDLKAWQVLNTRDSSFQWPGDEWGDSDMVLTTLDTCLFNYLETPHHLCELGAGAGRYTKHVFSRFPKANIYNFDVSKQFISKISKRLSTAVDCRQLQSFLISRNPRSIFNELESLGLVAKVDAVYSFDAMVHVDIHTLSIYLLIATAILQDGGIVAMNVANAANEHGLSKMLFDAKHVYRLGGHVGGHFQFMSPDLVSFMLERMGFSCEFHDGNGRDLYFTATLIDRQRAKSTIEKSGLDWWLD